MPASHVARRKSLKRNAARRLGVDANDLAWDHGILVYAATGKRISDVAEVSKPVAKAKEEVPLATRRTFYSVRR